MKKKWIHSLDIPSEKWNKHTRFPHLAVRSLLVLFMGLVCVFSSTGKARERLSFDLKLGFVKGGEAVMVIKDTVYNGRPAKSYHLKGRTTGVTDKLFSVNNEYESIINAETFLPYKAVRNAKEKKYRYYNEVFFYHDIDSAFSQKSGWIKIPKNLTDFLTVFFYFVNKYQLDSMDAQKTSELYTLHGHEVSVIKVRSTGTELVETKMGKVECYVISPILEKGKVLKRADGIRFYISKEGKFPVQLDFETKVGTLKAVLQSYKINGKEQIKK